MQVSVSNRLSAISRHHGHPICTNSDNGDKLCYFSYKSLASLAHFKSIFVTTLKTLMFECKVTVLFPQFYTLVIALHITCTLVLFKSPMLKRKGLYCPVLSEILLSKYFIN